jgi:hypothetical protein
MAKGRKTGGRKPGSRNKHTKTTLEAYASVFEGLGGVSRMKAWAEENLTEFYRIHARTLPLDVTSGGKELAGLTWSFGGRKVEF